MGLLRPRESKGWTIHFLECQSRDWAGAPAGQKTAPLFRPLPSLVGAMGGPRPVYPVVHRW
ncbi:MAG: hypothetical protein AAGD09_14940 [Cyanobacteria bacterium P01_F01_bin.56]